MQLHDILAEAWRLLARGAADPASAFRNLGVATAGLDGGPELRTVVLRGVDPGARAVWFHTDLRAAKVAELRAQPGVALLGWDDGPKVQLRLSGRATLHANDDAARSQWDALHAGSRRSYRTRPRSGSVLADPATAETDPVPEQDAYANFCAVRVELTAIEWLQLAPPEAPHGQRRARFAWRDGSSTAQWLVP